MELRSQAPHDGNCPNVKASEASVLLRAMLKALASPHPGRGDGEGWAGEPPWSRTVKICVQLAAGFGGRREGISGKISKD